MDQSAKTLGQLIIIFMCIFLILGVISFYFVSANARNAAYSIVEYIEIRGYDSVAQRTIEEYADSENLTVSVVPINEGIYENADRNRYKVDVTFNHVFMVMNFGRDTTYTLYTRAVDY